MVEKWQESKDSNNERDDISTKEKRKTGSGLLYHMTEKKQPQKKNSGRKLEKQIKMDILDREKGWLRAKDMAALAMMKRLEEEKRQNMKKCEVGRHTVCFTAGSEYKVKVLEKLI